MREKYIELVNGLSNYYKESVNLLDGNEKNKVINITLENFGFMELILKDIHREKIYYDSENYEATEDGPVQISKWGEGYLVSVGSEYKGEPVLLTYECGHIDFKLELYDYTKININKKYIKDDYRIKLGNKIAHNLLLKQATLGDEFLNEKEKNLIPTAMWIAILDSSQSYFSIPEYNKVFDLFIQYNGRYEKEEFLEKALEVEEKYADIKEVKKVSEKMRDCLQKLQTSQDRGIYFKMEEKLFDHLYLWSNIEPVYKVYIEFTNYMKDACEDLANKNSLLNREIEDYIKNKVGNKLIKAGFEEEYPFYRIKTKEKIYVLEFEVIDNKKVRIKMLQEIFDVSDELLELLEIMDYKYLNPEDISGWSEEICKTKEEIDEEVDIIINCLLLDETSSQQDSKLILIGTTISIIISYFVFKLPLLICAIIGIVAFIILIKIEKLISIFLMIWKEENRNENE